jgi:hypothetical protein
VPHHDRSGSAVATVPKGPVPILFAKKLLGKSTIFFYTVIWDGGTNFCLNPRRIEFELRHRLTDMLPGYPK